MYIHERKQWPIFSWNSQRLAKLLGEARNAQGLLVGRMNGLGFKPREEATLLNLTQDVVRSSQIEGENLDTKQVRSSIARKMGLDIGGVGRVDRNVDGVVEMMLDASRKFDRPLSKERLFDWHAGLFPPKRSGIRHIRVGAWRDGSSGPMQVVSGGYGKEKVHFEAPSHDRLNEEMDAFLKWFEKENEIDQVIKAAIAHFWFVTIHPFEDGNGRMARAIADMMLARSEGIAQRFYSMSTQIQRERKSYYEILEACQKGSLDISPWIEWFLRCLQRAISSSGKDLEQVLAKSRFWEIHTGATMNARQRLIVNRLLDGFEGKLTSSKWAVLTRCSQDSALRDILDLVEKGMLVKDGSGGRSTHYHLNI
ncbi:MAG: Fic family protein [Verrucomicrobiales bacterium]|nr:Fic family protein [Verrucomicrobiales bacterium]